MLFITPPFQVPDEVNHFYRAYQISEGQFIALKQDQRIGGVMPKSVVSATEPFLGLAWNTHSKTSLKTIQNNLAAPLEDSSTKFVDFPNTGMYSPVSYLPQATSIFILRKLKLPPLYIFYGARLFTLIFWIFCLFYAIRLMPFFNWFFALVALLPMSLFINMSLSADVVTNLLSFLLIAYILRCAFTEDDFTYKNFIKIALLAVMLASAKIVYTPLVLLYLLIPKSKWPSVKSYFIQLVALSVLALFTVLFWSHIMNSLYLPYHMYNKHFRDSATLMRYSDMNVQLRYVLNNGWYIWYFFVNSAKGGFNFYNPSYIGIFGWLDTQLPLWLINLSYFTLMFVALIDKNANVRLVIRNKLIIFSGALASICLIFLSQHLTWDLIGSGHIDEIQGRYFIPVFPLIFILLYNKKIILPKVKVGVIIIFSVFSLSYTVYSLYMRYYVPSVFDTININCDTEKVNKNNAFTTNMPQVFFDNPNIRNKEKAKSGLYSIKLNPNSRFGYVYKGYDFTLDDIVNVKVWRYGKEGFIVISGENNTFSFANSEPFEKDNNGWEHIELNYKIPKDMKNKEVAILIHYTGKDSSYFDDIHITHNKFKRPY